MRRASKEGGAYNALCAREPQDPMFESMPCNATGAEAAMYAPAKGAAA
jgi:hypothetical protein